jgi:sugar phosphate isomerase/epimerase
MDAPALVQKAAELEVNLLQICDNLPLHAQSEAQLRALEEAARNAGLTLEIGTRGTDPGHLGRYLRIARALEAPLVRTLITCNLAEAQADLAEALPEYEKAGIRLALENYEEQPCEELAALIRRLNSPWLGTCLDTVNSLGALEPLDRVMETLLPLAFSLHVKDFRIRRMEHRLGFEVIGAPAGQGLLEIDALLTKLAKMNAAASIVLELWAPFRGDIEETVGLEADWARQSVRFLRRYFR